MAPDTVADMLRFLAEFDGQGNQLLRHAFVISMNIERPLTPRAEDMSKRIPGYIDLPPRQAALAATLRRAFSPLESPACDFDELLRKLDCAA